MPEPIDREATLLLLDTSIKQFGENWLQDKLTKNGLLIAKQIVSKQPTIKAEPVRYGRWKKKNGEIYCTNCKKSKWSESFELMLRGFDFCPKCGARMDATDTNVGGKGGADDA